MPPLGSASCLEPAYQLSAPYVFAGDSFGEGWWVVEIQLLDLDGLDARKRRRYRLGEVCMISVCSQVRGEEVVRLGEPATAANANTRRKAP